MARITSMLAAVVLVLALASKPAAAQDPGLVASAKQRNVVDVQFFADPNFQQINTPFAYYDFPPIQTGSCSACEDFPDAPVQWESAVIAYSPTGGEAFQVQSN
ncbi:g2289 [Coccomyxa viridis]|uniref:G2289 protein n=1 Tax=Coccomyxa viridis TaxID=1274662 RepID=A0ABP1FQ81_9CHLO